MNDISDRLAIKAQIALFLRDSSNSPDHTDGSGASLHAKYRDQEISITKPPSGERVKDLKSLTRSLKLHKHAIDVEKWEGVPFSFGPKVG